MVVWIMEIPLKTDYEEYLASDGSLSKSPVSIIKGLTQFHAVKLRRLGVETIEELATLKKTSDSIFEADLLDRWITIAKIIQLFEKEQRSDYEKKLPVIALVGLEKSGKSSLFLTLKKDQTAPQPSPTEFIKKDNISFIRQKFEVRDFSGTEESREKILNDPELIPKNAVLFYVIDVTRLGSVANSLKYLTRLMDSMVKTNRSPLIIFCLHKNDDLRETPSITHIKQRINSIMKEQAKNFNHIVVTTSIFDLKSVKLAFHRALRSSSPLKDIIDNELRNWNETMGFMGAILFDLNKMIIAKSLDRLSASNKQIVYDELYALKFDKVNPNDPIFQSPKGLSDRIKKKTYILRPSASLRIAVVLIAISKMPMFLAAIDTEKPKTEKINFKHLNDNFAAWIDNYFAPIR
ncbi:MAG: ADP-ribosylation factor-like protein [Candidatus Hodarchaeales archaeon]